MALYAKMDCALDSNPKIRRAGREGREVFLFLLRRNRLVDAHGFLPAINIDPDYVADQLMMDRNDALRGVTACRDALLISVTTENVAIIGWSDEWSREPKSNAERQADFRRKQKETKLLGDSYVATVTKSNAPKVTRNTREEKKREEKKREGESARRTPHQTPSALDLQFSEQLDAVVSEAAKNLGADLADPQNLGFGQSPKPEKPSRRKPSRALPADWAPNAGHRELAAEQRVDVSAEAVKFRDYGMATGKTYADHDAAFRNWLRRAQPRQNGVQLARGSQAPRKFRDYLSELAARTSESEKLLEKPETAESLENVK